MPPLVPQPPSVVAVPAAAPPREVPMLDLKPQYAQIEAEATEAVLSVMREQAFILGPEVAALEAELADYCGTAHAVGVSSGTDALLAALMAAGIDAGDEVVTTPYTFFATAGAISRLGATPVFVDVEPDGFNIDPAKIEAAITDRTKAIVPVHLYGRMADMDPIMETAGRHGLTVIEDAAQAIGAEYKGRRAGSIGHFGCFSFFPSKNLGAFGDGGAVTCNDAGVAERLRQIRMHGDVGGYTHAFVGANFRLDALQAAVLRVKLRYLDGWSDARASHAAFYCRELAPLVAAGQVQAPAAPHGRHIYNQFVIRCQDRDAVRAHLDAVGVSTRIYYPISLHEQQCFASLGYATGDFPQSTAASKQTVALPIYPELTETDLRQVVDGLLGYFASNIGLRAA